METNELNAASLSTPSHDHQVRQARILLVIGLFVLGSSYPLTVACKYLSINHLYVLFVTVFLGSGLMIWGMAKYFEE